MLLLLGDPASAGVLVNTASAGPLVDTVSAGPLVDRPTASAAPLCLLVDTATNTDSNIQIKHHHNFYIADMIFKL